MKKTFIYLMLIGLLLLPNAVFAKNYNTLNLDEALTAEGIEHDFSNYEETDDQAIVYLFRGNGCGYCKSFLTYLNSIIDEYGEYFKVVTYEVWQDSSNKALMNKVAKELDTTVTGVPFIVIGDQYFPGYTEEYDDYIVDAIEKLYESEDRYDVIKEVEADSENDDSGNSKVLLIVLVPVIIILIGGYMFLEIKKEKK